MPILKSHSVLEIARGIKAFLRLDAGLVRGEVPDEKLEAQQRKLRQAHQRIEAQSREIERAKKQLSRTDKEELSYEALYEARIRATSPDAAIGGGTSTFDKVGRSELEILKREGLRPADTLVDLGCGTGRLAVHVIPTLAGGHYVGIDISRSMLEAAKKRIDETVPDPPCRVSWVHQTTPAFALDAGSVDVICAFSVINHMEHEDAYLYFKEALRVVRPGGRFVFSCLPVGTERAREVFLKSAAMDMQTRQRRVRHVVTSRSLMEEVVRLAGWTPVRWHSGDEEIRLPDSGESRRFHQSILVLEAPSEDGADQPA